MLFRIIIFTISFLSFLNASFKTKCVYISSYHKGYYWSDKIEEALKLALKDTCEVVQFNMDTKRNKDLMFIKQKAKEAKELIDKIKPSVVITSDDNAAKYLIKPYFNNNNIPFVFSGINWTAKEYNFSHNNITGIIEVTPIKELYNLAKRLTPAKNAIFIGDNTITDRKDFAHFENIAKKNNISIKSSFVDTLDEWKNSYNMAQDKYDFIILGHNSAIKDWDEKEVKEFLFINSNKLVLTTYSWMMPFSMVGLIIDPREQGEWAGQTAKAIIEGFPIDKISITVNKRWDSNVNLKLLKKANIKLSRNIINKSKKISME